MPLKHSPPSSTIKYSQKNQELTSPTETFGTPQTMLDTPHSVSEPNLNVNPQLPSVITPSASIFRNIKRKRLEQDGDDSKLTAFIVDMKDMFREFREQQQEKYEQLYSLVDEIRESIDFMSTKFDQLASRVEFLEKERKESTSYINKLETKLEYLEQSTRSSCLEFRNIPVGVSETKASLLNTVIHTGSIINHEIKPLEINDVFRIKSKDPANKTIIVDFTTVLRKEEFLAKFRKHIKESFKITTEHLKIAGPPKPIFISENLSARNKRLFFLAREAAKSNNYQFCWVKHGKIYIREKIGCKHLEVKCEADLVNIQRTA